MNRSGQRQNASPSRLHSVTPSSNGSMKHHGPVAPVRGHRHQVSWPCEPLPHSTGEGSALPTASTARTMTARHSPLTGSPERHARHSS